MSKNLKRKQSLKSGKSDKDDSKLPKPIDQEIKDIHCHEKEMFNQRLEGINTTLKEAYHCICNDFDIKDDALTSDELKFNFDDSEIEIMLNQIRKKASDYTKIPKRDWLNTPFEKKENIIGFKKWWNGKKTSHLAKVLFPQLMRHCEKLSQKMADQTKCELIDSETCPMARKLFAILLVQKALFFGSFKNKHGSFPIAPRGSFTYFYGMVQKLESEWFAQWKKCANLMNEDNNKIRTKKKLRKKEEWQKLFQEYSDELTKKVGKCDNKTPITQTMNQLANDITQLIKKIENKQCIINDKSKPNVIESIQQCMEALESFKSIINNDNNNNNNAINNSYNNQNNNNVSNIGNNNANNGHNSHNSHNTPIINNNNNNSNASVTPSLLTQLPPLPETNPFNFQFNLNNNNSNNSSNIFAGINGMDSVFVQNNNNNNNVNNNTSTNQVSFLSDNSGNNNQEFNNINNFNNFNNINNESNLVLNSMLHGAWRSPSQTPSMPYLSQSCSFNNGINFQPNNGVNYFDFSDNNSSINDNTFNNSIFNHNSRNNSLTPTFSNNSNCSCDNCIFNSDNLSFQS